MPAADVTMLAERFRRFAERECRGSSPLYEHLSRSIADDDEILTLAARSGAGQPVPNLLFASVHFLLLKHPRAALADFYPSLTRTPRPAASAFAAFREFCVDHRSPIEALLATRLVQTNEVQRCAYLFPAFSLVATLAEGCPLATIEIGASAGLNLCWDRYSYWYEGRGPYGAPSSGVRIECSVRGAGWPPLPERVPEVGYRLGIDLHGIDVGDEDEALWLRALVWPEHEDRATLLENAIAAAGEAPPTLITGDALTELPRLLDAAPGGHALCVFHTHTLNQMPIEAREHLAQVLSQHGRHRELYRLSAEWLGGPHPRLELTTWSNATSRHQVLAECDAHGRWLEWHAVKEA